MTLYTETQDRSEILIKSEREDIIYSGQIGDQAEKTSKTVNFAIDTSYYTEQAMHEQDAGLAYRFSFKSSPIIEKERTIIIPELRGIKKNFPEMTSTVRRLIRVFWAIVVSKALQSFFPINRTEISVFNDPAEERKQVTLRLFTEANASQAVAFWDSLENDVKGWISTLNDRDKLIFIRDISLRIHWS